MYRLAGRSSQAIKIYAAPLTAERVQKIRILARLSQPYIGRFTAWPSGLVLDERGQPRGLLLPVVEPGKDIHHLYTPSSRRKHFLTADWRFLVHVSGNVARPSAPYTPDRSIDTYVANADLETRYRAYLDVFNERRLDDLVHYVHDELSYNGETMTRGQYQDLLAADGAALLEVLPNIRPQANR